MIVLSQDINNPILFTLKPWTRINGNSGNNIRSLHSVLKHVHPKATPVVSQMLFNHNFTSKLESRGQPTTLDKHWPSILSQLSVSVDPGGKKSGGGSQSP